MTTPFNPHLGIKMIYKTKLTIAQNIDVKSLRNTLTSKGDIFLALKPYCAVSCFVYHPFDLIHIFHMLNYYLWL